MSRSRWVGGNAVMEVWAERGIHPSLWAGGAVAYCDGITALVIERLNRIRD
jgi:hypothetical protein